MEMQKSKIYKIVLGGVIIALGTILSLIKVFELPYGGSITLCSMLPLLIYSFKYGLKWGISVSFVYGIIQILLGSSAIRGFDLISSILIILFDFILAFSALGLGGLFRKVIKNTILAFTLGSTVSIISRLIFHIISGIIFFGSYANWYFSQEGMKIGEWILENLSGNTLILIYSTIYNASYMLPELFITTFAGIILLKTIKKQILPEND